MTDIRKAVQFLRQGRLVAFPTETVYGLGADATNPEAIARIYLTKGRPDTNPLIVHVAHANAARHYVADWPQIASDLGDAFWPGPLTMILPKKSIIPDQVTASLPTLALRVPNHPLARQLLEAFDGALAAPSANCSTRVSPTTAKHVLEEFPRSAAAGGHDEIEPAMILDGGACSVGIESTVIDLTTSPPTILRPGGVSRAELETVIGIVQVRSAMHSTAIPAASPGQQERHYAPRTPAFRFETSQRGLIKPENHGIVILSPLRVYKEDGLTITMPNDPIEYATQLYAVLRKLDSMNLTAIFIEIPPDVPQWAAVRDRLTRATRPLPA